MNANQRSCNRSEQSSHPGIFVHFAAEGLQAAFEQSGGGDDRTVQLVGDLLDRPALEVSHADRITPLGLQIL